MESLQIFLNLEPKFNMNMFVRLRLLLWLPVLCCLFSSCEKSSYNDPEQPTPPYYSALSGFFTQFKPAPQTFTFNVAAGATLQANNHTKLYFPPIAFMTTDNKYVRGNVTVELTEVYHKSEMMFSAINTETQDQQLLESGGMYYLRVLQNGKEVKLAPGINYTVSLYPGTATKNGMHVYFGSKDTIGNMRWTLADTAKYKVNRDSVDNYYSISSDSMHWIGCQRVPDAKGTSVLSAKVTNIDYPLTNSVIYVFSKNNNTAERFTPATGRSSTLFSVSNLVEGDEITVVAIVEANSKIYSTLMPVTVKNGDELQMKFQETTSTAFKNQAQALN
jgi:hypothetical protein